MTASWLLARGIDWRGSDMDQRHRTFSGRHPSRVKVYRSESTDEIKESFASIFRSVMRDTAPVHIIDCRAQADQFFIDAINEFDLFSLCKGHGIGITLSIFPTDELESLINLRELVKATAGYVNYVVVENKVRNETRLYNGSAFEKTMISLGAKALRMPTITKPTMLAMEKIENESNRGISFAEFATIGRGLLDPIMATELGMVLAKMYRQYDAMAELLLPPELARKIKSAAGENTEKPAVDNDETFAFNFSA